MSRLRRAAIVAFAATVGLFAAPHVATRNGSARNAAVAIGAPARPAPEPPGPARVVSADEANPLLEPEATGVTKAELASISDREAKAIADELDRLQTRDAEQLVNVITEALTSSPGGAFAPTYLLSIAFAETRGRVLAVSPAGAAGLAQATPAAYRMEGLDGKLYVTNDYLVGTRAYIMKKPLGDVLKITRAVISRNTPESRLDALRLLETAKSLRTSGMEELEALEPLAPPVFMQRVEAADRHNLATLEELERLLRSNVSTKRLKAFRTRVDREYSSLMKVQQITWKRYAKSLETARDRVLRNEFGQPAARVIATRPYEAGEVLGEKLDARFSPKRMALFLNAHLHTKQQQARDLGIPEEELDQWTAALYNGGLVNVGRLRAGLLDSLRETEQYMKKVPAMKERLESAAVAGRS